MFFSQELNTDTPLRCFKVELGQPNPHWHEHYEIIFVEKGEICLFIENAANPLILGEDEMILLDPNVFHSPMGVDGKPNRISVFSFMESANPQISRAAANIHQISQNRATGYIMSMPETVRDAFREMTDFIVSEYSLNADSNVSAVGNYISLILSFFEKYGITIAKSSHGMIFSEQNHRIRLVCSHIESHPEDNFKAEELAKIANYSLSHFFRLFKEVLGCSVHEYITRVKIREAQQLMRSEKMNVTEVSYRLGFSHPNNFSRTYKRITGKNPRDDKI